MRLSLERPTDIPLLRPHVGADLDLPETTVSPTRSVDSTRRDWIIVLAITLLGGLLRFTYLDRPVIWGDEAITYGRTAGPYSELLISLRDAGFGPLHYELYWLLARKITLTPFFMRMVPAIAGTLMIPAMFFLARQIVGRRAALLTTLFTACSAYLLVYSRDAKMYSEFWLMSTLNMGCALWWFRSRRLLAWLSWIAAGAAMVGLQAIGAIVVALQIILLLTQSRVHWRQAIYFVIGVALIFAGPAGYYLKFNQYAENIGTQGWGASGIHWIDPYNAGRDGGDLLLFNATAFLYSWEWPRTEAAIAAVEPAALEALKSSGILLLVLLALGLFPWRTNRLNPDDDPADVASEPWWRSAMWLSIWIALPAYGFYCASVKGFLSPFQILWTLVFQNPPTIPWPDASQPRHIGQMLATLGQNLRSDIRLSNLHWPVIVLAPWIPVLCFLACGRDRRERLRKAGLVAMIAATVIAACGILYACAGAQAPGSVWMPRYLGVCWPAVAIVVSVLFLRLPGRWLRVSAIVLFIGINLAQFSARILANPEAPVDRIVRDVLAARDPAGPSRTYVQSGGEPSPGTQWVDGDACRYFISILGDRPLIYSEFRNPPRDVWPLRRFTNFAAVAQELNSAPAVRELIVWDRLGQRKPTRFEKSAPSAQFGTEWTLVDEEIYPSYDHWTWRALLTGRRRRYVRTPVTTLQQPNQPAPNKIAWAFYSTIE